MCVDRGRKLQASPSFEPRTPIVPRYAKVYTGCFFLCRSSEMGRCSGNGVEWNHQFSLLVDDANVEMLEILVLDGYSPQGYRKPMARCKIPLMR